MALRRIHHQKKSSSKRKHNLRFTLKKKQNPTNLKLSELQNGAGGVARRRKAGRGDGREHQEHDGDEGERREAHHGRR